MDQLALFSGSIADNEQLRAVDRHSYAASEVANLASANGGRDRAYLYVSQLARIETFRKALYRPPYYIHKWWARRPGTVFRAILLDMLLEPDASLLEAFYQKHDFSSIVVLDPFMGGGTTVGEALRLGCKVVGCDINPVSWFLVSQAMQDIGLPAPREGFDSLKRLARDGIREMYTTECGTCGGPASTAYVSWVKQIECKACGGPVDLNTTDVLMADMASRGGGVVLCPGCGEPSYVDTTGDRTSCVHCGYTWVPAEVKCGSSQYACSMCGHTGTIVSAIEASGIGPPAHRMRCIVAQCPTCGKQYQKPSSIDLELYARIETQVAQRKHHMVIPRQRIPAGHNTDQMRRYGYRYWHEMFNARQLMAHHTLFSQLRSVQDERVADVLALLVSSVLEFNSMFCSAKGLGTGAIRHVFAHHAFIPPKEPLEANVWGVDGSSGGLEPLFERRLCQARRWANQPVERELVDGRTRKVPIAGERLAGRNAADWSELLESDANMMLLNQSSEALPQVPDGSVDLVVTDPPYSDNVMYSELSDYFYVWLHAALGERYAAFAKPHVDDTREAVTNHARGRDATFYAAVLGDVFRESAKKLKPDGRVVFTFHHSSDEAWQCLTDALCESGLVVERWWPVHAEMTASIAIQGKNGNGYIDIVFVCIKADALLADASRKAPSSSMLGLATVVPLLEADYAACGRATEVQRSTVAAAERSQST